MPGKITRKPLNDASGYLGKRITCKMAWLQETIARDCLIAIRDVPIIGSVTISADDMLFLQYR